jgi:hypothetical protein
MGQCETSGKHSHDINFLFWNPSCQEGVKCVCNTESSHSIKITVGLTSSIFLSQEDAIIIAKSENAYPDDILLEDDIPDDVLIKMHTIKI